MIKVSELYSWTDTHYIDIFSENRCQSFSFRITSYSHNVDIVMINSFYNKTLLYLACEGILNDSRRDLKTLMEAKKFVLNIINRAKKIIIFT